MYVNETLSDTTVSTFHGNVSHETAAAKDSLTVTLNVKIVGDIKQEFSTTELAELVCHYLSITELAIDKTTTDRKTILVVSEDIT